MKPAGSEQNNSTHNARRLTFGLAIVIIVVSIPALENYYKGDKGKASEISQRLEAAWKPEDVILTIPDYKARTYTYYIEKEYGKGPLLSAIYSANWDAIPKPKSLPGDIFLITPYPLSAAQASILADNHFQPFYTPNFVSRYSQAVWVFHKSISQTPDP